MILLEWFWRFLLYTSIIWYGVLVFYVGFRGGKDIKEMIASLTEQHSKKK